MVRRLLLGLLLLVGCSSSAPEGAAASDEADETEAGGALPAPGGTGAKAPWGGSDASRWRPEAAVANVASAALNEAAKEPGLVDALVAVPVRMLASDLKPFGDGQSNAAVSLEGWTVPPVVATLRTYRERAPELRVELRRELPPGSGTLDLAYATADGLATTQAPLAEQGGGDRLATLALTGPLAAVLEAPAVLVRPSGWQDWFPLVLRAPVQPVEALLATVPASMRSFADGGPLIDHAGVSQQQRGAQAPSPFEALAASPPSGGFNAQPFVDEDVHARFPAPGGGEWVTAVGRGYAWVATEPQAPFKALYLCFDGRAPEKERAAPSGGVPSGAGWHRIGDAAETVLNTLERGPMLVGWAADEPWARLPSGGWAYGLGGAAVLRLLRPGEALTTRSGDYHWFAFHQPREVCSEVWVHPCAPDSSLGFACGGKEQRSEVTFRLTTSTAWGQGVRVVGDAPELGAWDVARGLPLDPASYPVWSGSTQLAAGQTVRFKFVKTGAGEDTWEAGPERTLTVPLHPSQVEASWP